MHALLLKELLTVYNSIQLWHTVTNVTYKCVMLVPGVRGMIQPRWKSNTATLWTKNRFFTFWRGASTDKTASRLVPSSLKMAAILHTNAFKRKVLTKLTLHNGIRVSATAIQQYFCLPDCNQCYVFYTPVGVVKLRHASIVDADEPTKSIASSAIFARHSSRPTAGQHVIELPSRTPHLVRSKIRCCIWPFDLDSLITRSTSISLGLAVMSRCCYSARRHGRILTSSQDCQRTTTNMQSQIRNFSTVQAGKMMKMMKMLKLMPTNFGNSSRVETSSDMESIGLMNDGELFRQPRLRLSIVKNMLATPTGTCREC